MEKKLYEKPIIEFIKIDEEDILTASNMFGNQGDFDDENIHEWNWN